MNKTNAIFFLLFVFVKAKVIFYSYRLYSNFICLVFCFVKKPLFTATRWYCFQSVKSKSRFIEQYLSMIHNDCISVKCYAVLTAQSLFAHNFEPNVIFFRLRHFCMSKDFSDNFSTYLDNKAQIS